MLTIPMWRCPSQRICWHFYYFRRRCRASPGASVYFKLPGTCDFFSLPRSRTSSRLRVPGRFGLEWRDRDSRRSFSRDIGPGLRPCGLFVIVICITMDETRIMGSRDLPSSRNFLRRKKHEPDGWTVCNRRNEMSVYKVEPCNGTDFIQCSWTHDLLGILPGEKYFV